MNTPKILNILFLELRNNAESRFGLDSFAMAMIDGVILLRSFREHA